MAPSELARSGDFFAVLFHSASGMPKSIDVRKGSAEAPLLRFDLDAVDAMGFCDASPLMALPERERAAAVSCLSQALHDHYGGKNMLAVPDELKKDFERNGFCASPRTPSGGAYGRLLVADTETTLQSVAGLDQQSPPLDSGIGVVTDKVELDKMCEGLSELLLRSAPFAAGEKSEAVPLGDKRPFYTPEAMRERLEPVKTHACALVDTRTGKPIAFVRCYIQPGLGAYVSDLVVDRDYRGRKLGLKVMRAAADALAGETRPAKIFVIAGDDREQAFFEQALGFRSIAASGEAVALENGGTFMFGLIPRREILLNLPEKIAAVGKDSKDAGPRQAPSGDERGAHDYRNPARFPVAGADADAHGRPSNVPRVRPKDGTDIIR